KLRFALNGADISASDLMASACTDWKEYTYEHTQGSADTKKQLEIKLYYIAGGGYWLIDNISIVKISPKDPIITVSPTTLSLEEEKTGELTATLIDEDSVLGATPAYEWTSSDDTVATVIGNGATATVTAVKASTEPVTITVTAKNADASESVNATCSVTVKKAVVNVTGKEGTVNYTSLQEAIAAAATGDTIKLLGDVTLEEAITLSKITLDLNGKTLTAPGLTSFDGNVVDNSKEKTGVLKATFVPAENNTQMPIYNGTDGYVFVDIEEHKQRNSAVGADTFELIFKPSFGTGTVAQNTLLAAGGESAKISIRIRLEWTDAEGNPQSKDLEYTDAMVQEVYGKGKAFYIKASGANSFSDLKITPLVESKLDGNIEWLGTKFSAN
ncbi:MAG: Ig-like domain-containing protein, partial [Lachnospiraceae bacterium]|nr:Ig-like domain-containing protein [Lachnospiraceae bacterium]